MARQALRAVRAVAVILAVVALALLAWGAGEAHYQSCVARAEATTPSIAPGARPWAGPVGRRAPSCRAGLLASAVLRAQVRSRSIATNDRGSPCSPTARRGCATRRSRDGGARGARPGGGRS